MLSDHIQSKIVLIPKTKASTLNPNSNNRLLKLPQYYIHKYIIKTEEDNNQFSNHIRARNSEFAYQKVHLGNNNIYTKSNISTMNSNPPLDANCNIQQLPYRVYNDGHSQLSGSHAVNSNGVVPYNSNGISLNSYNQEYTYPNNNMIQIPNLYNSRF